MHRLRLFLRLNGASCLAFGLLFVLTPASVAAFLAERSTAPPAVITVLGVGLILNGMALFLTAHARAPSRFAVRFFSIGDLLWVVATLVLIVAGLWIDRMAGLLAALAVAIFVGTVGWLQWRTLE